jgi:hypothetical protein
MLGLLYRKFEPLGQGKLDHDYSGQVPERSPAEPTKLLEYWMEWEEGETPPGRVISNLKTAGMRELLEALVEAQQRAANLPASSGDPGPEG